MKCETCKNLFQIEGMKSVIVPGTFDGKMVDKVGEKFLKIRICLLSNREIDLQVTGCNRYEVVYVDGAKKP